MSAINEERVKNRLDEMLRTIQTEADPNLLNQYRALIRKKVSFFQRSYLSAYLLMLQDQGGGRFRKQTAGAETRGKPTPPRDNPSPRGAGRSEEAESRPPVREQQSGIRPPTALPNDEAARLFISVGRNRRVFPREILGLIGTKTGIAKEDIGLINILNNYSFVQIRTAVADEVIAALNGITFRGRTLAVNYAKARKDGDADDEDTTVQPVEKPFEDEPSDIEVADTDTDAATDANAYTDGEGEESLPEEGGAG